MAQAQDSVREEAAAPEFKSRLSHGRTRFLAHVIQHGLDAGRRTPEDFLRHFPPAAIMEGLRNRPELRARILSPTTGIKEPIALKKSVESSGEDLQIALDEGVTSPDTVVTLFHPDDRVRYLEPVALWAFVAEGEFWKQADGIEFEIAKSQVAFMLDRAIEDSLMTHRDVVEGLTVERIAQLLPRAELGWILQVALDRGRSKKPFRDEDLLSEAPMSVLAEHVPLPTIWDAVVIPKIAQDHGLVPPQEEEPAPAKVAPVVETTTQDDAPGKNDRRSESDFDFSDEPTVNGDLDPAAEAAIDAAPVAARAKKR